MVRIAALDMLEGIAGNRVWPFVSPLLSDSSRGVRIKAVLLLLAFRAPINLLPTAKRSSAQRRSLLPRSDSMPTDPRLVPRSEIFTRVVGFFLMPRTNIKLGCGLVRNTPPRGLI
jgi:hypothetical protein